MSENKYIIDKDSLTGIADAIRDKLGNGASADDPAAGYYPDPEKSVFSASFTTVGGRHQTGYARYTHIAIWGISASDMTAAFGDTICGYLRITSLGNPVSTGSDASYVEQREFSIIPYMNNSYGTSKKFTWAKDATILIPIGNYYSSQYGQPSVGIMFMWQDSGNYKYNYDITVPDIRIEFLDQNQNLMTPAIGGFSDSFSGWSDVSDAGDLTHTFEGEVGYSPIPFSIDDMQDKITNYLSKGGSSFEYPIPTKTISSGSSAWYLNLESTFSSVEDFKNRFLQASVNMGTGYQAFYLVCGKDGKPASMKELGIPLRSDIQSYLGSWDMNDVRTSYENDLTFPLVWLSSPVDNTIYWLYVTSDAKNMVFCEHGQVGCSLSNSGYLYVAYKEA